MCHRVLFVFSCGRANAGNECVITAAKCGNLPAPVQPWADAIIGALAEGKFADPLRPTIAEIRALVNAGVDSAAGQVCSSKTTVFTFSPSKQGLMKTAGLHSKKGYGKRTTTMQQCHSACLTDADCGAYSFSASKKQCALKTYALGNTSVGNRYQRSFVSSRKITLSRPEGVYLTIDCTLTVHMHIYPQLFGVAR